MHTDKAWLGIEVSEDCNPFTIRGKVLGPQGSFLKHIQTQTGCKVHLRGLGSGSTEPGMGDSETTEPLHLFISGMRKDDVDRAKSLADDLLVHVRRELEASMRPAVPGYPMVPPIWPCVDACWLIFRLPVVLTATLRWVRVPRPTTTRRRLRKGLGIQPAIQLDTRLAIQRPIRLGTRRCRTHPRQALPRTACPHRDIPRQATRHPGLLRRPWPMRLPVGATRRRITRILPLSRPSRLPVEARIRTGTIQSRLRPLTSKQAI